MSQETKRFEFEEYVLDAGEKVLLRDGRSIPVPPKILELLLILVENHGHVVEKEVLIERLWTDTFVEESNLTFSVRKLRKILGDETQNPRFIETIPKRGYRFVAVTRSNNDLANQLRPESVGDDGLVNNISERSFRSRRPVRKHPYLLWTSISIILLVGLSGLLWWFITGKPSSPGQIKIERLTYNGKARLAAVSPDGNFVAYVTDDEGDQFIWLKNVAAGNDVQILPATSDTLVHSITFSPDGNYVYYVARDTLYQLPILGGLPKEVLQNFAVGSQYKSIAFSPDGKQFAFIRRVSEGESALVIVNSDGTGEQILASSQGKGLFRRSAVWSPDGKVIALIAAGTQGITVVRVADGHISTIPSPPWTAISQIAWRSDGSGLFVVATEGRNFSSQIWWLSYPDSKAENITNDFNNYQSISSTADGRTIAAVRVEQSAHIWLTSTEDWGQLRQLTHGIEGYDGIYGLNFLPNGDVIYEATPGEKGQVWAISSDGRNSKVIVNDAGSTAASPNGKYIVFQSVDDAKVDGLFKFDIGGGGEKTRLTTGKDTWVTFSPDARWVIFTRWRDDASLWKVSIDGGEEVKLTDRSGYALAPAVSPNGKLIAFHWAKRDPKGNPEIAVIPFEGGAVIKTFVIPKKSAHGYGKHALQWAPDGQAIDYTVFRDNASNIWRQPIDGSPPFQVTNFTDQQIFNFAYSPDGKKVALSRGTYARDVVLLRSDTK